MGKLSLSKRMGEVLRVFASGVSLVMSLARSVASGVPGTVLCAGVAMTWAGLAVGQEEATVAQRQGLNPNKQSFQMKPVAADELVETIRRSLPR